MAEGDQADPPMMQRLYDRIWLLALAAVLFWAVSYLLWGFLDLWSVPAGVILP
ncbi:hypothetical protein ACKVMT_13525 [Halobacteriales archaeon Cl-PHB]